MSDLRLGVLEDLSAIATDVRERFGVLDPAQLDWRPAPGTWSVAQCLEHLITTTDAYLVELRALAAGTRRVRAWERWSPFSGFFGRVLVDQMRKDANRTRTPARFAPPSAIGGGVVARFGRSQEELAVAARATMPMDWSRVIVTSPFFAIATYSLLDAYQLIIEHQRRHVRQAQRVMSHESFPAPRR